MIGIDIESISRISVLVQKKPKLIEKFFSKYEWEYANKKANMAETLTGLWCAKEAVVKAFYTIEPILITDVKIRHNSNGVPFVFSTGKFNFKENYHIYISVSHSREYATAVALVANL